MPQAEIDPLVEVIEEGDALPYQLDLLEVVELQPESAGGDRRGQGGEGWPPFENESLQTRPFGEVGGGAANDAAADDDEIGAFGR